MPKRSILVWALIGLPSLAIAADQAQIFKCTDGSGNITYQNEPCPKDSKAGRIEIFDNRWTATREEREAEWRRNAAEHRLLSGMPARWVREALGEPTEIRDTPSGGAAQLWLYNLRDRSVQIGMLNDQVLWFRDSPVSSPSARVVPPVERPVTQAVPAAGSSTSANRPADLPVLRMVPTEADRLAAARASAPVSNPSSPDTRIPAEAGVPASVAAGASTAAAAPSAAAAAPSAAAAAPSAAASEPSAAASVPTAGVSSPDAPSPTTAASAAKTQRTVARGQDCKQALADLGPPDRQRDVPALDTGSDPATEYFYESTSTGRLRIVCANGKVEGVDRSVAR